MKMDLYNKLVDMYAGQELPTELEADLEVVAAENPALRQDMKSLRATVDTLKASSVDFSEETYQRILMKLYARGAAVETRSPDPVHMQYQLPMHG